MPFGVNDQRTLWPGYVYPSVWDANTPWLRFSQQAQNGFDRTGSIAVMNPSSGPGTALVTDWVVAVNNARGMGHQVVGYVHTSYGARAASEVNAEVDKYYAWYHVDGIFVDEMSNDSAVKSYYQALYAYINTKLGSSLVVGNPGAAATTDWQVKSPKSADVLVIHENTAAAYLAWTPPSWVLGSTYQPSVFAHLVHACSADDLDDVIARSKTMRAGYRYITDDVMPNPWDSLGHWPTQVTP